jgi:hypothetical protein
MMYHCIQIEKLNIIYIDLCEHMFTCTGYSNLQGGTRNDPVFDLVLNIQPCNERGFVTM